jgi:hypothetical protein
MRLVLRTDGKRQDIGGFVLVAEVTIQPPNGSVADENDRERWTVKMQSAREQAYELLQAGNWNPVPALTIQDHRPIHEELSTSLVLTT